MKILKKIKIMNQWKVGYKSGINEGASVGSSITVGMLVGEPIGASVGAGFGVVLTNYSQYYYISKKKYIKTVNFKIKVLWINLYRILKIGIKQQLFY